MNYSYFSINKNKNSNFDSIYIFLFVYSYFRTMGRKKKLQKITHLNNDDNNNYSYGLSKVFENGDILYYIVCLIDDPKSFNSLLRTNKYCNFIISLHVSKKKIQFLRPITDMIINGNNT